MQNMTYGQPIVAPNMQMAEYAQREQIKANIWMQKERFAADVEIGKKASVEMQKADIAGQREMQQTKVLIAAGKVYLTKETFQGVIQKPLEIELEENILYIPMEANYVGKILKLIIYTGTKHQRCIWFSLEKLDDRLIRRKFTQAGITFGFGKGKELEIQKKFLAAALVQSKIKEVPIIHGWYQVNGEFRYAFPEMETWKEVCCHAE